MARVRKTEEDQMKLLLAKRRYEELLEYADGLETHKDSTLWKTIRKALISKADQYGEMINGLIDEHRRKMDPVQFQIEVVVARRSQKICMELADMPKNMIESRQAARKEIERIDTALKIKPGQVYRDSSPSSRQKN